MARPERKTYIGAFLFLDIAGFSKLPNSDQIAVKANFDALLSRVIERVPPDEYVLVDTGDGAFVCFHDPPELAVLSAVVMRQAWNARQRVGLRLGVHLGPVQEVRGVNGQRNVIGDGINTAQRIMSFARAGEIIASSQYRDAIIRVYGPFEEMFGEPAVFADKHERKHEGCLVMATGAHVRWAEELLATLNPPQLSRDSEPARSEPATLVLRAPPAASKPPRVTHPRLLAGMAALLALSVGAAAYLYLGIGPTQPGSNPGGRNPQPTRVEPTALPAPSPGGDSDSVGAIATQPSNGPAAGVSPPSQASPAPEPSLPARTAPAPARVEGSAYASKRKEVQNASTAASKPAPASPARSPAPILGIRCATLLQKISIGEPLSDAEQSEYRSACR